jgi:hypothetical protein
MRLIYLILIAIDFGIVVGCRPKQPLPAYLATPAQSLISPSGSYVLAVTSGRDDAEYWSFEILSRADAHVEYHSTDRFYRMHTTYILWGKTDEVWVYSGDVGTCIWRKQNDGAWLKFARGDQPSSEPPDGLKVLKPKAFQ